MPAFTSERSQRVRSELSRPLVEVVDFAIKEIDFSLICGARSLGEQQDMYNSRPRKSHLDGIKKKSKHQVFPHTPLAEAFDFIPAPFTTWDDRALFTAYAFYFMGIAATKGIELRSGIDWDQDFRWTDQTFHDFPHIERMF
jgi:hypothetical protein